MHTDLERGMAAQEQLTAHREVSLAQTFTPEFRALLD
jgi:hypothetical protein